MMCGVLGRVAVAAFAVLAALQLATTAAAAAAAAAAATVDGAVRTRFVHLAQGVPGVLYEPEKPGPKASTAVFIMHSSADYLAFPGCTELSRRGYRVLCANNGTSKTGLSNDGALDRVLLDAKAAVAWLRAQPGVRHVVLLGHSGGGTVMSAYQMIAEHGTASCRGATKIWQCPETLAGLPRADGLMLIDSNWGLAAMTLFSIDPAVTREDAGQPLDPRLDMYDPANGFREAGSRYTAAFVAAFLAAEGRRNDALIASARHEHARIGDGTASYTDDAPFVVPGAVLLGSNNKLFSQDVSLMSRTKAPWPLLHGDGSMTTEVVRTVRLPENRMSQTPSYLRGALKTSVNGFLSTYAIRTDATYGYGADGVTGVDWTSTYASPPGNVGAIEAPLLVMGMTAHWEFLAAETIYGRAASRDRTLVFVEGADHLYNPCRACQRSPGEFGDTVRTTYDYIDKWLSEPGRFDR